MDRSHGILRLHFVAFLPYIGIAFVVAVFLVILGNVLHRLTAGSVMMDAGLYGVTGRMGRGKSYLLAFVAYLAFKRRRAVFANYPLRGAELLEEWADILAVPEGSLVLIDEAQLWWSSSDHAAPVEVRAWITQLRKRRITCLWASQDVSFVARWLRLLSFGVWECRRYGRGHRYTLVDPSQAGRSPLHQKSLSRFHVARRKKVMALYDTFAVVSASREWGAVDPAGLDSTGVRGAKRVEPARPLAEFYREDVPLP